ncbi:hypothetical protein AB0H42_01650 [Nocardia sp. NPDC050799]
MDLVRVATAACRHQR